jgi:hypothetical protein
MNKILFCIFACVSCTVIFVSNTFSQKTELSLRARVGSLELSSTGYGKFTATPFGKVDTSFTDYSPYAASFSLWIGTNKNEPQVSCGDGNEVFRGPEWYPRVRTFQKQLTLDSLHKIETILESVYSDFPQWPGHNPIGIKIIQNVVIPKDKKFVMYMFTVTPDSIFSNCDYLDVGLMADVDVPDQNNKRRAGLDKIDYDDVAQTLIFSNPEGYDKSNAKLVALKAFGSGKKVFGMWNTDNPPKTDREKFAALEGAIENTSVAQNADYAGLIALDSLKIDQVTFPQVAFAISQTSGLSQMKSNFAKAGDLFRYINTLGVVPLNKSSHEVASVSSTPPTEFVLYQNFPNPFNPQTTIRFSLAEPSRVSLKAFNTLGQQVATLLDNVLDAQYHEVQWVAKDNSGTTLPSGVYFVRIDARSLTSSRVFNETRKLVYTK